MQNNLVNKLRYQFENSLSSGVISIVRWLGILTFVVILFAASIVILLGLHPEGGDEPLTFGQAIWEGAMQTIDPGAVDWEIAWPYRTLMIIMAFVGILFVSILIGLITSGIEGKIEDLRRGRSLVIEKDHTLIYGWSSKIFQIIQELVIANENRRKPRIVILADKDKVEMENEIAEKISDTLNTEIICRTGSTIDIDDVNIVNPQMARSIIILPTEDEQSDINVVKTIMALVNNPQRKKGHYNIVTEINDPSYIEVAEIVGKDEITIIKTKDLISRITVQTCRQPGLSTIYTELLNFHGAEFYFREEALLTGKKFKDALFSFNNSAVIGINFKDGKVLINPPMDTVLSAGDKIIALTEDDDTLHYLPPQNLTINPSDIIDKPKLSDSTEKTLLIGWNSKAESIIREMDKYVMNGSELVILAEQEHCRKKFPLFNPM